MDVETFFATALPPNCPPSNAVAVSEIVLRLVASDPPTAEDFLPNSMLPAKKCPPSVDSCRWAGISVWSEGAKKEVFEGITKIPKNSHLRYVARVKIDVESAVVLPHENSAEHLTCWTYKNFDITTATLSVEALDAES
jgi:hypothetical protein